MLLPYLPRVRCAWRVAALLWLCAAARVEAQLCPAVTPLTFSCGNGRCDFHESEQSCVSDCADRWSRAVGYYAEYSHCPKSEVHYPASISELSRAVRGLVAQNKTVKFMGTGHSTAKNYCATGGVIVTSALKGISEIERWHDKETVVFEAGVTFTELTDHLAKRGKWLGYTVVGFGPINAAGGVATGIHGSSLGGTAAISSRVLEIDMVRQDGSIRTVSADSTSADEWRALRANLGALGGMARIRVEVDPLQNIRGVSTRVKVTRAFTTADLDALVAGCDYAFLMFYPANDEWVRFCGTETREPALSPLVVNNILSPDVTPFESTFFQTSAQFGACHPWLEKALEKQAMERMGGSPIKVPDGAGGFSRVNDVIGPGHRMVTIDAFPSTQPQFSQYDFEASLRIEDAAEVLNFIHARFDRERRGMPLVGALVRFDRVRDDTLLGSNAPRPLAEPGHRIVHIELPVYRPYAFNDAQLARYLAPYTDVMEHIIARYPSALLHFGKNTLDLFGSSAYRARIAPQMARFQEVVNAWDPYGVYANEYLAALGVTWPRAGQDFASHYLGQR